MILTILFVLLVMAAVMSAAWFVIRATNDGGWGDVFWTYGTGLTLALAALTPSLQGGHATAWRGWMTAALVLFWGLRLGTYVALRVARGPEDVRYRTLKREWGGRFLFNLFGLLIVQAPATALLSVSVLIAARAPAPEFRLQDGLGAAVLALAIVGEGIADDQMRQFKAAHKGDHGAVCDTGLWAWSRHPNYLFEVLGWIAYPVIAIDLAHPATLLSLIAPVAMFLLLRFGTGVPPLEAAMLTSKGDAYRRYQERVSPFLPRPPKARSVSP